ncbi:MAG: methyl-accepting chemotaxis protein [Sedimenticola sp.]|nr:methyl-accepting chemotaxis protein [Sedimenticola sp.]
MSAIFLPAARLLSRVNYPTKFALLILLCALPIVVLSTIVFSTIQTELEDMSQEQRGLRYINELRELLELLPQHRGMTNGYLKGAVEFKPQIEQRRVDINKVFAQLALLDNELAKYLMLDGELQRLQERWSALERQAFDMEAKPAFTEHTGLITQLVSLMTHVADTSRLNNDRYPDSRYMVEMLVSSIPNLVEPLGQARGQGAGVAGAGTSTPTADFELTVKVSRMQSAVAPVSHALEVIQRENPQLGTLLGEHIAKVNHALDQFVSALQEQVIGQTQITLSSKALFTLGTAAITESFELFDLGMPQLQSLINNRLESVNNQKSLAIVILVVVIITVLWLVGGLIQLVLGSIRRLQDSTAEIAEGNLTARLKIATRDEMLKIETSINRMAESFHSLTREVKDASQRLVSSSQSMSTVAEETNSGVNQQLDQVTMIATAITEMAATVNEIAKNASQTAEATHEATREVKLGKQVVSDSVESIGILAGEVELGAQVVTRLADDSAQIGMVVEVIQSIAEQTNLLALNAAIEAARAGDQGRGFAVVADEVRTLAARTQRSTQEIQEMIESLQAGTREAVKVMQSSQQRAGKSVEEAQSANDSLDAIASRIQTIADMSAQIATAGEEQSAVTEEINKNILIIKSVVEKTAEGSGQMNHTASEVSRMALQLETITANSQV